MQEPIEISVREACDIAKVDRDRFNEAVSRGAYPCAPSVVAGATRLFDEAQAIALCVYGYALGHGYPASVAGDFACRAQAVLQNNPNVRQIAFLWTDNTLRGVTHDVDWALKQFRLATLDEVEAGDQSALEKAFFPIVEVRVINVAAFRARIRARVLFSSPDVKNIVVE